MKKINQNIPIIILSGGKGERFVSKENLPKQLSKVSSHPIIMEIILFYFKNGFNFFILPLGYKSNFFTQFFNDKKNIKIYNLNIIKKDKNEIKESKINILLFDAGLKSNKLNRIKKSIKYLDNKSTKLGVCYGDIFANISFQKELFNFKRKNIEAIAVGYNEYSPFGHIKIKDKMIKKFYEKPKLPDPINIGFYFFNTKIFSKIKTNYGDDLETDFLPKISKMNKLSCHIHKGYHFTVNSQKDLINVKQLYKNNKNFFKDL
ncbi:nucleotidyltransferase family protein [Candidatus Pelagibacter sp. Uisw_113]|uniref:nucleotidyltransferase family protein n=1 Tax=Candidatus Pelagibacter sp. Uisw_113 TaxID=3230994 RepID=UPI0039ED8D8B